MTPEERWAAIGAVSGAPWVKKFVKNYKGKMKFDRKMNEKFTDNALP